jgi:predicted O-methyltransferase YrrM
MNNLESQDDSAFKQQWAAVDQYVSDLLVDADPILDAVLRSSAEAGLPAINVSPVQGKLLQVLARSVNAKSILEVGTLGGYSTIWLARGLTRDGRLITLEADPKHAEIARANFTRAGLDDRIELRLGPALQTMPQLVNECRGPFDLIFIDADKPCYAEYLEWALRLSRRGTLIVADNVVRKGAIADPYNDDGKVIGIRRFLDRLASEPRVSATVMQTVGAKGYDGFAIAYVAAD